MVGGAVGGVGGTVGGVTVGDPLEDAAHDMLNPRRLTMPSVVICTVMLLPVLVKDRSEPYVPDRESISDDPQQNSPSHTVTVS